MLYTFEQIQQAVRLMQADQGPIFAKMRDILLRYDGDWVIPLPDVSNEPKVPQLTPALVGEAIDGLALRASSVTPQITAPALDPSKQTGKRSVDFARRRAQIVRATYEQSRWNLGRRRYYRHLTAYHTASIVVVPDMKLKMPRIEVRDPLSSYCEPQAAEALTDPSYAAFVNRHSAQHLRSRFPHCSSEFGGPISKFDMTDLWDVIEWYDEEDVVWGLMGPTNTQSQSWVGNIYGMQASSYGGGGQGPAMELERLPNRAGCVPVVVPHNVSLGRVASRIGSLLGLVDLQAKLMALHITAQEKAIFPDVYVIGRGNAAPELTNGEWQDGRTGNINMVQDADQIGVLRSAPDPTTGIMIDRLERNFKTSASSLPQQVGETYGALRTGRGIDALSGIALDPRIQEMHEITEAYLPNLNKAILGTYKGHWGSKQYSLYCGYGTGRKLVEFTPNEHIETTETAVSYFYPGADVMQLTQVLGSLYGAGLIAGTTVQEVHPMIGDPQHEMSQLREENLEKAMMEGLSQQIMTGALSPTVAAMFVKKLRKGTDIFDALIEVDNELRELQATQAPEAPEGMMAAPEAMPGITGGPAADQMPAAAPPGAAPPPNMQRMRELMAAAGGAAG